MGNPLVSVAVIAYNSAKTITETLDSIREQTYSPLELIISDDASTDDTVKIAREWIEKNRSRFVRTEVVVAEKNGGIPANCNRGIGAARGEFLKSIAGDDMLTPDCVADNVAYMQENPDAQIVFSLMREFSVTTDGKISEDALRPKPDETGIFSLSAEEQHEILASSNPISACMFFRTPLMRERFRYNESYPILDDWPMWLRLTGAGVKLHFLPKVTVGYRIHPESVSGKAIAGTFYKEKLMESNRLFYLMERRPEMLRLGKVSETEHEDRIFLKYELIMKLFKNRKTFWTKLGAHVLSRILKMSAR